MRTFGRNTIFAAAGLVLATFAVAPAYADDGGHQGNAERTERSYDHDRRAHRDWRHDRFRFGQARHVVYHRGDRTIVIVRERPHRMEGRHRHHVDPVVRRLVGPLFW